MEAQRFPDDYDGIVAGMPANNWTRLMAGDFDATLAVFKDGVNNLPPSALGLLHRAALAACDSKDGVVDGVLEDPRQCAFDPAGLSCKAGQAADDVPHAAQVEAARRVYGGLKDPKTGAQLYPGLVPGSEPFWPNRDLANPFPIPIAHYKWLVFADPNWDWKTFDFSDPADYRGAPEGRSQVRADPQRDRSEPQAFRQRGGKLLQYHGWNDQLITPLNSINYYESVLSFFGWSGSQDARENAAGRAELLPVVHGAGHGALRRRHRPEHLRHAGGARAMGGAWRRAGTDRGDARRQRRGRPAASPLSVSAGRGLQGQRRHQRCGELRVPRRSWALKDAFHRLHELPAPFKARNRRPHRDYLMGHSLAAVADAGRAVPREARWPARDVRLRQRGSREE